MMFGAFGWVYLAALRSRNPTDPLASWTDLQGVIADDRYPDRKELADIMAATHPYARQRMLNELAAAYGPHSAPHTRAPRQFDTGSPQSSTKKIVSKARA